MRRSDNANTRVSRFQWPVLIATLVGLIATMWALGRSGLGNILAAIAVMGWSGFAIYVLSTLPILATLGIAWATAMRPDGPRRIVRFAWARTVREAANELLPFSQLGGLVVGTRVLIADGFAPTRVYAATIVDLTTEMMAQLVLTLGGLIIVSELAMGAMPMQRLAALAWTGAAGVGLLAAGTMLLQRPMLRVAGTLAGKFLPAAEDAIDAVRLELIAFGRRRSAMVAPFAWNLAAWLLSILSSWIALQLLDAPIPISATIALETLIFALRSSAFLVPAALGVQEIGYMLIAPLFGLNGDAALALSLVKRAREITIGLPTLILWQWSEARRPAVSNG